MKEINLIQKQIKSLQREIKEHNIRYFVEGNPTIPDEEFDKLHVQLMNLKQSLRKLQTNDTLDIISLDSDETISLDDVFKSNLKSLKKTYKLDIKLQKDLEKFREVTAKFHSSVSLAFFVEPKIDGVAFRAIYKQGNLVAAGTRGLSFGESNLSSLLKRYKTIPSYINVVDTLEIRGELFINKQNFQKLIRNVKYSGPRHAATAIVNSKKEAPLGADYLEALIYGFTIPDNSIETHRDGLQFLTALGLKTTLDEDFSRGYKTVGEVVDWIKTVSAQRHEMPYEMDGVVIKANSMRTQVNMGETYRYPLHSLAFKFTAQSQVSQVRNIEYRVGASGKLTPILIVNPVAIGGTIVQKVNLQSVRKMNRLKIHWADKVEVLLVGNAVPQIFGVLDFERDPSARRIELPSTCPSCGDLLKDITRKDGISKESYKDRYCANNLRCPAQKTALFSRLVSKQGFDIRSLGPNVLEGLIKDNIVETPLDLLEPETCQRKTELKHKLGLTAYNNLLERSKVLKSEGISLESYIYAIGLPGVGPSATKRLANIFETRDRFLHFLDCLVSNTKYDKTVDYHIERVGNYVYRDKQFFLKAKMHLGTKLLNNLTEYLCAFENLSSILKIAHLVLREPSITEKGLNKESEDSYWVAAGEFSTMQNIRLSSIVLNLDGQLADVVNFETTYLIIGKIPKKELARDIFNEQLRVADLLSVDTMTYNDLLRAVDNDLI